MGAKAAIRRVCAVTPETIDGISEEIRGFLARCGIDREIGLRMGLVTEEILIALDRAYAGKAQLELTLAKRFGKPWITLVYRGPRFDHAEREGSDEVSERILNGLGIVPIWSYRAGVNRITFRLPSAGIRTELLLAGAVLLSVLLGLCGGILPEGVKAFAIRYFLSPVSDIFINLLSTLAPFLIFLSVVTSIFKGKSGMDFSRVGRYIILRYVTVSAIGTALFTGVLIPFFRLQSGTAAAGGSLYGLFSMLLGIVPDNLIRPFAENNTMQIILLAVLFGTIILGLDNRVGHLTDVLSELQVVFSNGVELVCGTLPLFVFTSLLQLLWENSMASLLQLWRPLGAVVLTVLAALALLTLYVSLRYRVSFALLIRKLLPAFLTGLATASSMATYSKGNEMNKTQLGIAASYSDLAYPLGISLYEATYLPIFLTIAYYLAEVFAVPVSPVWFITLALICLILAYATPQVSGGPLVTISIMMTQLGIPTTGLALAGTMALILDFFCTGTKVTGQQLEMLLQADHLKQLDVERLRKNSL